MKHAKIWLLVVVLGLIDGLLTLQALGKGAVEMNPVVRYLLSVLPNYLAIATVTLISISVGVVAQYWIDEECDHIPVLIFAVIWTIPVLWNSWQLIIN